MSSTVITTNRLRRALGIAVDWSAHSPGTATGPADLDLPLGLAAAMAAAAPRAAEVSGSARGRRRAARHRPPVVRR
jgi:hypothetical protein